MSGGHLPVEQLRDLSSVHVCAVVRLLGALELKHHAGQKTQTTLCYSSLDKQKKEACNYLNDTTVNTLPQHLEGVAYI
jgi:hypothetical protein